MHQDAIQSLLYDRYRAAHDATPVADYPAYLVIGKPEAPLAVLGFRAAGPQALFAERYIDRPIEQVLSERYARPIARHKHGGGPCLTGRARTGGGRDSRSFPHRAHSSPADG